MFAFVSGFLPCYGLVNQEIREQQRSKATFTRYPQHAESLIALYWLLAVAAHLQDTAANGALGLSSEIAPFPQNNGKIVEPYYLL